MLVERQRLLDHLYLLRPGPADRPLGYAVTVAAWRNRYNSTIQLVWSADQKMAAEAVAVVRGLLGNLR
ncbi:hypothetical protein [Streptomyces sp. BE133]|uniref:hypothetical protein n=1 Tax=Streptomyces sp. BE133 TaxID=3002523 RepID=UPI003FA7CE44